MPYPNKSGRVIDPPLNELGKLRTPLNPAEELVLKFFDRHLPPTWEIYIQPHLNGLKPDFVLLNPKVGVAVYEVKGWNLDARDYIVDRSDKGMPVLMGKDKGEARYHRQKDNPIDKIYQYKQELGEVYLARVLSNTAYRVITAGVIFPYADDDQLQMLFDPFREQFRMNEYPNFYPLVGRKALETNNLPAVFPGASLTSSQYMNENAAQDLRGWLVEPDHSRTQRTPLDLDERQEFFTSTRTTVGYRRIKGPAGSGKSLILAVRAATLAGEGKHVLIISYNITLLHYLRDLAGRWPNPGQCLLDNITFLNFHAWCKRVCVETGHFGDYQALWRWGDVDEMPEGSGAILEKQMPALISRILDEDAEGAATRYDAVLVDEGQDFRQNWWEVLRKIHRPGGEMMLVADTTQDIYGRTQHWATGAWTDRPMEGAGFRGTWAKLEFSYRLPGELARKTNEFARRFLPTTLNILPEDTPLALFPNYEDFPCRLRWIQTNRQSALTICYDEILSLIKSTTPASAGLSDITFLVPDTLFGRQLAERLSAKHYNILHTFAEDTRERRKQKHAFYMGAAKIKGTTIHSFKGWESSVLLIYTGESEQERMFPLLYTAMTRLKRHQKGSFLTIVSSMPCLNDYGSKWPDFKQIERVTIAVDERMIFDDWDESWFESQMPTR